MHLPSAFYVLSNLCGNRWKPLAGSPSACMHVPQHFDSRWMVLHQISYRKNFYESRKTTAEPFKFFIPDSFKNHFTRKTTCIFRGVSCLLTFIFWISFHAHVKNIKFVVTLEFFVPNMKIWLPRNFSFLGILATALKLIAVGTPHRLQHSYYRLLSSRVVLLIL